MSRDRHYDSFLARSPMILRGLPVCTSNTDFGNDAAAPDKPLDPQLQLLIERWPTLSKAVQQQIMRLVDRYGDASSDEMSQTLTVLSPLPVILAFVVYSITGQSFHVPLALEKSSGGLARRM